MFCIRWRHLTQLGVGNGHNINSKGAQLCQSLRRRGRVQPWQLSIMMIARNVFMERLRSSIKYEEVYLHYSDRGQKPSSALVNT
jgi:hypothetical protein